MAKNQDLEDDLEPVSKEPSKRITAAILAFLLGGFGVHKFYLGNTKAGIIQILSNVACGAGAIIAFIEFIIYLTKSDADFIETYQIEKKSWF
jgi:TM2 domain-containing membrane protein YozV